MDYDEILEHLGEVGTWNVINYALLAIPSIIGGINVYVNSFTGLEPNEFRCLIPECDGGNPNPAYDDVPSNIYPIDEGERDFCSHYPTVDSEVPSCNTTSAFDYYASPVECKTDRGNFVYDLFEMNETVVTEWDLVCGRQYMVALVGSIYMCGMFFGSFLGGYLGDKIGRVPAMEILCVITCVSGLCGAFVDKYEWYCVTRFFTAVGAIGLNMVSIVLAIELAGTRTKTFIGINVEIPFAIGASIVSVVGIRIKDWRKFHLWTSGPLFISLFLLPLVSESPRWLLKTQKYDRFAKTIQKAAKLNKKQIPKGLLQTDHASPPGLSSDIYTDSTSLASRDTSTAKGGQGKVLGPSALFANVTVTKITLVLWINWIVVTIGYYGISLGIGELGSDIFINFLLVSLVEIPCYIFATLTVDHLGRKTLYVLSIMLTGVSCMAAAYLADGVTKTSLALIGKFGVAIAFAVIIIFTTELYPTEVRSTAVGCCSTLARIGGIAAPQVALYFPTFTFQEFPLLFMGGCSIFGGLLALLLPESLGQPLVESLEDIDRMGQTSKSFFSWWSAETLKKHQQQNSE